MYQNTTMQQVLCLVFLKLIVKAVSHRHIKNYKNNNVSKSTQEKTPNHNERTKSTRVLVASLPLSVDEFTCSLPEL